MNPSRLQPRFGDKTLGVKVLCPEKEAAVSRGLQQSLGENSTLCCLLCRKSIISERRFETATYQVYMKKKTEKKNQAIMQVLYGIEKLLKSYPRKLGVSMRSRVLDGVCRFLLTPLAPHSHMWGQSTLIISSVSPKRDRGPKRVAVYNIFQVRKQRTRSPTKHATKALSVVRSYRIPYTPCI